MNEPFDIQAMADELESAAEFLTRRRGIIRARWIFVPLAVCLVIGLGTAVLVGRQHRPEMVGYTAGLYVCAAFFVHAYSVAWRSGNFVWRYAAMGVATAFLGALAFLHADDAAAWVIYTPERVTERPPEPRLFIAVVADVLAIVFLWVHGLFLGLGSHVSRVVAETAARAGGEQVAEMAEDDQGEPGTRTPGEDASPERPPHV